MKEASKREREGKSLKKTEEKKKTMAHGGKCGWSKKKSGGWVFEVVALIKIMLTR